MSLQQVDQLKNIKIRRFFILFWPTLYSKISERHAEEIFCMLEKVFRIILALFYGQYYLLY